MSELKGGVSMRIIFLNSFPLNAFPFQRFTAAFERISLTELVMGCDGVEVVNYIRHPATVQALSTALGRELKPSAELYNYQLGDVIYVIALKQPQRGVEATSVKPEELDVVRVEVKCRDDC
jgi:hypothetical protein